jgi:hypothetical protein
LSNDRSNYDAIETRRERVGINYRELATRAHVPYTRLFFVLAGKLSPAELYRVEHALKAAERERERGY